MKKSNIRNTINSNYCFSDLFTYYLLIIYICLYNLFFENTTKKKNFKIKNLILLIKNIN